MIYRGVGAYLCLLTVWDIVVLRIMLSGCVLGFVGERGFEYLVQYL